MGPHWILHSTSLLYQASNSLLIRLFLRRFTPFLPLFLGSYRRIAFAAFSFCSGSAQRSGSSGISGPFVPFSDLQFRVPTTFIVLDIIQQRAAAFLPPQFVCLLPAIPSPFISSSFSCNFMQTPHLTSCPVRVYVWSSYRLV